MSYSIMYDRQFIRSTNGVTPVILAGSSNVWTGSGKEQCRERSWSVLGNSAVYTEKDLMSLIESWTGGKWQEHWKQNGKWVDDASLLRWVKKGIKTAAPIEDIMVVNRLSYIKCHLSVWDGHEQHNEFEQYINTTQEFDEWAQKVNNRIQETKSAGMSAYPIIKIKEDWDKTKLQKTNPRCFEPTEKVLLKSGNTYLVEVRYDETGKVTGHRWNKNVKNALEFSREDALEIMKYGRFGRDAIRMISTKSKEFPYNAVVKMIRNGEDYGFVRNISRSRIQFVNNKNDAKHYRDEKAANKAVENIKANKGLTKEGYSAEVVIIEDEAA